MGAPEAGVDHCLQCARDWWPLPRWDKAQRGGVCGAGHCLTTARPNLPLPFTNMHVKYFQTAISSILSQLYAQPYQSIYEFMTPYSIGYQLFLFNHRKAAISVHEILIFDNYSFWHEHEFLYHSVACKSGISEPFPLHLLPRHSQIHMQPFCVCVP